MTTLAQLTMNAGEGIPGSVLKWNLEKNAKHFDRVLIVDGDLTDDAKAYYSQFPNVEALDSPWKDDHAPQYRRFADELKDGEWCLYMDDDEAPSEELCTLCKGLNGWDSKANMIVLPSILYITENGKRYYRALHKPFEKDPRNGGHTKPVLFKKKISLDFITSPPPSAHVTPTHGAHQVAMYASQAWYYHFKSVEAYIINDCLFALMNPIQERYTPGEAKVFKEGLEESGIKTLSDFRTCTSMGSWGEKLLELAIDNREAYDRPISRLYMWYFHICRPGHLAPSDASWDDVVNYVLADEWRDTYRESKKAGEHVDLSSTPRKMMHA